MQQRPRKSQDTISQAATITRSHAHAPAHTAQMWDPTQILCTGTKEDSKGAATYAECLTTVCSAFRARVQTLQQHAEGTPPAASAPQTGNLPGSHSQYDLSGLPGGEIWFLPQGTHAV